MFFDGVEFAQSLPAQSGFSMKEFGAYNLIEHYRNYGHLKADLDPLKLQNSKPESFDPIRFQLDPSDLDQTFQAGSRLGLEAAQLKEIIAHLETVYCGTLTAQLADCRPEVRDWFRRDLEGQVRLKLTAEEKREVFRQLSRTESLEKFIHTRYVGTKRFSIEGGDALIPMLEWTAAKGTSLGVEELVIGMAHRGRINVLANFLDKGLEIIFSEFDGTAFAKNDNDGDVKYHLRLFHGQNDAEWPLPCIVGFQSVAFGSGQSCGDRDGARETAQAPRHPVPQKGRADFDSW